MDLYTKRKVSRFVGIGIIIIMCLLIVEYYNGPLSKSKNTIKVDYLDKIPAPVQKEATGKTSIMINNGIVVDIQYLASYEISARVVDTFSSLKYNSANKLGTLDIGMSWGDVAKEENHKKISYSMLGDRRIRYVIRDGEWVNMMGGISTVGLEIANTHVIPENSNIEKLLNKIEEGDYIKLEGYLVSASFSNNDYTFKWNSSLTRSDSGDGACEVMLVKDVKWLRSK